MEAFHAGANVEIRLGGVALSDRGDVRRTAAAQVPEHLDRGGAVTRWVARERAAFAPNRPRPPGKTAPEEIAVRERKPMAFLNGKSHSPRPSLWRRLLVKLMPTSVSYRPERHYMRGPGPKYRERHEGPLAPHRSE
jgi:hypothetical protein